MQSRVPDLLPDEARLLSRLLLNATDAARVCGVTVRQLTYWTDKGIVSGDGEGGRSYDLAALRKAIAIKQAMLDGYTLEKAAQLVETLASGRGAASSSNAPSPNTLVAYLDELCARLAVARETLSARLALADLRRAAFRVEEVGIERLLGGRQDRGEVATQLAVVFYRAAETIDRTVEALLPWPGNGHYAAEDTVKEGSSVG